MLEYFNIIKFLVLIVILLFSSIVQNRYVVYKNVKEKIKTVIIIIFIYFIIYLLLGLIFGFKKSPYSLTFNSIASNLFLIVGTIVMEEYIRTKLLVNTTSFFNYFLITICFIFLRIDFSNFNYNLEQIFEFIVSIIIPAIVSNCLLTYLSLVGGFYLNLAYTIPFAISKILFPVFPDLDYFLNASLLIICYVTIFIFVNHEHLKITNITNKTNSSPITMVFLIFILLIFISFVAGFFPYRPVAIISNSMKPAFSRGDIIVRKKIDKDTDIKIDDIIEYEFNDTYIIHRVVGIFEDTKGTLLFTTKGDNNNMADQNFVTYSQIIGIVKFTIPYAGYPTVLFTELLLSFKH